MGTTALGLFVFLVCSVTSVSFATDQGGTPAGFSAISESGLNLLSSFVSNREWAINQSLNWMNGSSKKTLLSQKLRLFFTRNQEEMGFVTATSGFGKNFSTRLRSITWLDGDRTVYEQITEDGHHRFWINNYSSNHVGALLDLEIANTTKPISFYPEDKVCIEDQCRPESNVRFLGLARIDSLVIDVNPEVKDQISIEYHTDSAVTPTAKYQYHSVFPIKPVAPEFCSDFSASAITAAAPGFKCRLSSLVEESSTVVEKIERKDSLFAWKEVGGKTWFMPTQNLMSFSQANQTCTDQGGALAMSADAYEMTKTFFSGDEPSTVWQRRHLSYSTGPFSKLFVPMKWFWVGETNQYYDIFRKEIRPYQYNLFGFHGYASVLCFE